MKKYLLPALLLLCLSALLGGCTGYSNGRSADVDGVHYRISDSGARAYAVCYYWDLDPDHTDIYIADKVEGAEVDRVGGYFGTGVPEPFLVYDDPAAGGRQAREAEAQTAQEIVFTVHLGKNIRDVILTAGGPSLGKADAQGEMRFYFPRLWFEADPENSSLRSENGALYRTRDNALIHNSDQVNPVPETAAPTASTD